MSTLNKTEAIIIAAVNWTYGEGTCSAIAARAFRTHTVDELAGEQGVDRKTIYRRMREGRKMIAALQAVANGVAQ